MAAWFTKIPAAFTALSMALSALFCWAKTPLAPLHVFSASLTSAGKTIPNLPNTVTIWDYSHGVDIPAAFYREKLSSIQYAQIVSAVGGSDTRDLFRDPLNMEVTDDYDFTKLVNLCKTLRAAGLRPYLKLGSVPRKLSDGWETREFNTNVRPPKDYNLWHAYIKAMAQAMVDAFGLEEVRGWRCGTVSEFNNYEWFCAGEGSWDEVTPATAQATAVAMMKLYDYTVDALQQVLGEEIDIGVHSMPWEKNDSGMYLLEHCAIGTNYCAGQKGTRITFAAVTNYIGKPGDSYKPDATAYLREAAKKYGLQNLYYGIDEGFVGEGANGKPLQTRLAGRTWQAAMLACKLHSALDTGTDYFCFWGLTSVGSGEGLLPVSTQVSNLFRRMAGANRLKMTAWRKSLCRNVNGVAAYAPETGTLYLMLYVSRNGVDTQGQVCAQVYLKNLPVSGEVKATRTLVSDDSNYYDDWLRDVRAAGVTEEALQPPDAWGSYDCFTGMRVGFSAEKYAAAAELRPTEETFNARSGTLQIRTTLQSHSVVLYEIHLK
jgi:xylan 1,4-beta-xylosidase